MVDVLCGGLVVLTLAGFALMFWTAFKWGRR